MISSLGATIQMSVRRSRADWPIVASAGLICVLAATLLAAGSIYAGAVSIAGLQRVLADAPVTQANIAMDNYRGGLVIFRDAVSHRWCVVVHGLPPAPAGNVYQFWFITTTGMVRSVEVDANSTHPAIMTVGMPGESAPVMGAALTVEPAVNRSSEPQGMQLAHVMF